ncbi:cilia- and flagella-associated protein 299-like [Sphaeramia orbicularis]|uniref:cilia- and flagella-associated protein 299-like n=1 Tax=Sphaeramia orbicularis TaxID=375764 RepID=UPI00117CF6E5|nr:cilia- and flagella-associated protein 299-like [Sphaeramia orbicularis]
MARDRNHLAYPPSAPDEGEEVVSTSYSPSHQARRPHCHPSLCTPKSSELEDEFDGWRTLASAGKELKDNFLKALAEREEANRSGKMTSVIFIRDHNTLGQEVSGYIDYAHRLKTQDFQPYFSGKKRLVPGRSDLCYYNWKTQVSTSNSSPNFEVIYDDPNGLLFKNKRDKKILNVDPSSGPGEDSKRTFVQSDLYVHVVIYDHNIRTV